MSNDSFSRPVSVTKKYKYAVFCGRFQPWHNAHQQIAYHGLDIAEKLIIVLGSKSKPRTIENPWNIEERKKFISASLKGCILGCNDINKKIIFTAVTDKLYNDTLWLSDVNTEVNKAILEDSDFDFQNTKDSIVMIGSYKDEGSWWLNKFPQWSLSQSEEFSTISSTDIRNLYFSDFQYNLASIADKVTHDVFDSLSKFAWQADDVSTSKDGAFETLCGEWAFVKKYKEPYEHLPYGVKHVTTDAVVFCSGYILLVKRRSFPGRGLWALPGGHIEMNEDVNEYAAIRELREETKLDVPLKVLEGSLKGEKVFGHPRRSLIGRVITHTFMFELSLPHDGKLPKVKGADDAVKAKWVPIGDVKEEELFDDHFSIISFWKGRISN